MSENTEEKSPMTPKEALKRFTSKGYRHRAFLLYCMMDDHRRSYRLVGRCLQRSEACMRIWSKKDDWHGRIAAVGEGIQTLALREYAKHYGAHLVHDAASVESRMSIPFRPELLPPSVEDDGEIVSDMGARGPATREHLKQEIRRETEAAKDSLATVRRFSLLLEALLGRASQQIASGRMKVSARDIPALIRAHQEIAGLLSGAPTGAGEMVQPSVRVVDAQRRGGDITQAMLEDAEECVAVLRGIQASKLVADEVARMREAAAVGLAERTNVIDADDADGDMMELTMAG